jgi:hypothetical protein
MDPEKQQRKLDEAAKRRRKELDAAIAAFALALGTITDHWQTQIEALFAQYGERLTAQQLYHLLQAQIPDQLGRLGYAQLVRDTTRQYLDSITAVQEQLDSTGLARELTHEEQANVRTMQQVDHDRLLLLGTIAATSVIGGLVLARITEQPKNQVKPIIEKPLLAFCGSAGQMVATGLYTAERYSSWQMFSGVVGRFLYTGPADPKNRAFCMQHVGKTYTKEQILNMSNDQGTVVWLTCGGYKCRHRWTPKIQ